MAVASARLGGWLNESVQATLVYNDANNAVQSVTVANNSPQTATFTLWKTDDPATTRTVSVPAGTTQTFDQLGGGWRYSFQELPPGDPKGTNVGYGVSFSG